MGTCFVVGSNAFVCRVFSRSRAYNGGGAAGYGKTILRQRVLVLWSVLQMERWCVTLTSPWRSNAAQATLDWKEKAKTTKK